MKSRHSPPDSPEGSRAAAKHRPLGFTGGKRFSQESAFLDGPERKRPKDGQKEAPAEEVDCRDLLLAPAEELAPSCGRSGSCSTRAATTPRFQEEVLGRRLWAKQVEVCQAIARSPITVVPAGRAVGKSFLLAGTVLWWLYTRPMSLVITTGPDHRQVVSVLWKEIRRALRPRFEQGRRVSPGLVLGHDHLTAGYNSPQRLSVKLGTDWGALGFAAQYEEGFSGQHAGDLLVIVDEASGVAAPIWSAIHGLAASRAGGGRQPDPLRLPLPRAPRPGREGLDDHHVGRHLEPRIARRPERRLARRAWRRGRS